MDGKEHYINDRWDLIIAHPPCTYLTNAGAVRLYKSKGVINEERYTLGLEAKDFFMKFIQADCDHICVENPIPSSVYNLPKYTQIIQPYWFGDPYSKKTCLWLKGLKPLIPTNMVDPVGSWVSAGTKKSNGERRNNVGLQNNQKQRSKTFLGIASAMAEQWSLL